jgi:hypothetical protein
MVAWRSPRDDGRPMRVKMNVAGEGHIGYPANNYQVTVTCRMTFSQLWLGDLGDQGIIRLHVNRR